MRAAVAQPRGAAELRAEQLLGVRRGGAEERRRAPRARASSCLPPSGILLLHPRERRETSRVWLAPCSSRRRSRRTTCAASTRPSSTRRARYAIGRAFVEQFEPTRIAVGRDMRVVVAVDGGGGARGRGGRRRRGARPRDGRHRDGLFRGRRAGARRRHRRHRVAQPEGVHRHEDRPRAARCRSAASRACSTCATARSRARGARRERGEIRDGGHLGPASSSACSRSSTSTRCKPLRVVIDAANGMAGAMLPPVLERLPMLDVVRCYFEPDGTFPNHEPNPLLPENREFIVAQDARGGRRLRRRVRRRRRPVLLRRRHRRVRARRLHDRALRRVDPREGAGREGDLRRARVVGGARGDPRAPAASRSSTASGTRSSSSGCARRTRSSAARCRRTTTSATSRRRTRARCRSCSCASSSRGAGKLSESAGAVPRALLHHRRDQHAGRRRRRRSLRSSKSASAPRARVSHLDGLSVEADDWHFNVRPSNTEPLLRLNLEARSQELMERKRDEVLDVIRVVAVGPREAAATAAPWPPPPEGVPVRHSRTGCVLLPHRHATRSLHFGK